MAMLIEGRKLYKKYNYGDEIFSAIDGIDISIDCGDFAVITGASGSGKSSLLSILATLSRPTSGEVVYQEKNVFEFDDKKIARFRGSEIGYVFQDRNLLSDLTVFQNISISGYLYEKPQVINKRTESLLGAFDIEKQRNLYPHQLSGGQQQRVAIARSLINVPKVLFLDEPTGSLNLGQGEKTLELLTRLNHAGQTIVMVTHDLKAACRGNKLFVLKDGKLEIQHFLGRYQETELSQREGIIYNLLKSRGV